MANFSLSQYLFVDKSYSGLNVIIIVLLALFIFSVLEDHDQEESDVLEEVVEMFEIKDGNEEALLRILDRKDAIDTVYGMTLYYVVYERYVDTIMGVKSVEELDDLEYEMPKFMLVGRMLPERHSLRTIIEIKRSSL